jgi:IclR family acetate operon transcriptional repressor
MEKDLNGRVQSVDRAMKLLEVLGEEARGLRLTDLARKSGLSLTTVHRLLTTLEQRHFVQFSQSESLWHIGIGAFTVGTSFSTDRNFAAAALPVLRHLRDQTRETANIGIVDNDEILLLEQIQSREITRSISTVGCRTPMTASGMGKAVLACYSSEDVRGVVRRRGLRRSTPSTITNYAVLEDELTRFHANGFSFDNEEYRVGLRCVAAPVFDRRAEVVCAISVSGTADRIPDDRVHGLGMLVAKAAADLSRRMGYTAPAASA